MEQPVRVPIVLSPEQEFKVTRNDEPILFIYGAFGATWAHEEFVFKRPIEKIGSNLKLWQGDTLLSSEKNDCVKVVAHWKRIINRRLRKLQETKPDATLHDVIWMGDYTEGDDAPIHRE